MNSREKAISLDSAIGQVLQKVQIPPAVDRTTTDRVRSYVRESSVQKTVRTFCRLRRRVGGRCRAAGDGGVRIVNSSSSYKGEFGIRRAN